MDQKTQPIFDDLALRLRAIGFVAELPKCAILDEAQRVPEIFTALKTIIDRKRSAGRFILTASANVLLIPRLAERGAIRRAASARLGVAMSGLPVFCLIDQTRAISSRALR